jgi:hypothetical protein
MPATCGTTCRTCQNSAASQSMCSQRAWQSTGTVQQSGAHAARQRARAWAALGTQRHSAQFKYFGVHVAPACARARTAFLSCAWAHRRESPFLSDCAPPSSSACGAFRLRPRLPACVFARTDTSLPRSPRRLRARTQASPSQRQLVGLAAQFGFRFRCVARARGHLRGAGRWRGVPGDARAGSTRGRAPRLATGEPRGGSVAARVKQARFTSTRRLVVPTCCP